MVPSVCTAVFLLLSAAPGQGRDITCFQAAGSYSPAIDFAADLAIVYGVDGRFAERAQAWRERGYGVGMMTGIAWGGYGAYFGGADNLKKEEIQTRKDGSLFMHGGSATVGYNVPTLEYVEFLKSHITPALEAGVSAVFLEEPEFWAETGWSEAFKKEWQQFYGEPWQPPDSSVDAQYRSSKLKYELYFRALKLVIEHVKEYAATHGCEIECHVPTHSLLNYAHWRIVSPESHLVDIPGFDGYIAQVWTGTARTPNFYQGVRRERTFETAFLEYGQMVSMARVTGKKLWLLHDPVEDNPNRSWEDYRRNYECTVIASLLWPEAYRYEVMPWPSRVFAGAYPKVDLDTKAENRENIPADYATIILIIANALNNMNQEDVRFDTGSRGIGVIVSDTMMFQRAAPHASDRDLGGFYGLALPLLKAGMPVEPVQFENATHEAALAPHKILFLTYEHQKPARPEYHDALAAWVRSGGGLIFVDDNSDPYHDVREWWNNYGGTDAKAHDDLLKKLGVGDSAYATPQAVGAGFVRLVKAKPSELQHSAKGADQVRAWLAEMAARLGISVKTQSSLGVRRGPYVIASVLDETPEENPSLVLAGHFVDLWNAALPVVRNRTLRAGERTLLYDLDYARARGIMAKVVAAGARIREEQLAGNRFRFAARGPAGTTAVARVITPAAPLEVVAEPARAVAMEWDDSSSTARLSFENSAEDVVIELRW